MKNHRLITIMTAALMGISAAGVITAVDSPVNIIAEAANDQLYVIGDLEFICRPGYGMILKRYTGTAQNVSISSWYGGTPCGVLPVCEIGENAFANNLYVSSVSIPYTVKKINKRAFYHTRLTNIDLSDLSYLTIGEEAFASCDLKTVIFPSKLSAIQRCAFDNNALTNVDLSGVDITCTIGEEAFTRCGHLQNASISATCVPEDRNQISPFDRCPSLNKLNNHNMITYQGGGPSLYNNTAAKQLVQKFCFNGYDIGFVDNFCSAMCLYAVEMQTKDWMSQAVKARQLHDWLLQHCKFEDGLNGESMFDANNSFYSTVFLSLGINERGPAVGEAASGAFSQAYTMLLKAANIDSYVLKTESQPEGYPYYWNVVKADNKYYQCDVTSDQSICATYNLPSYYGYFMKSGTAMDNLHNHDFAAPSVLPVSGSGWYTHEFLNYKTNDGTNALNRCYYAFTDANGDGILDGNWDFNTVINSTDTLMLNKLRQYIPNITEAYMAEHLSNLVTANLSPEIWYSLV